MRLAPILLFLLGVPVFAQLGRADGASGAALTGWTLGFQRVQPSLSASLDGIRDGKASLVDTDSDLGLGRDGNPFGGLLEYQGQAHGFQLTYDSARYRGDRVLPRAILIDGRSYAAGTPLQTQAKVEVLEGLWTYKFVRRPDAWLGFDLGAQVFRVDLQALTLTSTPRSQSEHSSWIVPQVGLTGWSSGVDGLLESRVYARYITYRGATSFRYGVDARAYLYPKFGLRVFFEDARAHIPRGSVEGDLDLRADRRITGLGLVIRF
ncbi:hypothetical protein [Geothrix mesophila]|uniref:hypothetical protein n=1 Tax=Geothrix mesophila TaxID=2922723 RepID=UPI001FABBEDC|nr:hypothetical protein [Geothrix sp. SG198]